MSKLTCFENIPVKPNFEYIIEDQRGFYSRLGVNCLVHFNPANETIRVLCGEFKLEKLKFEGELIKYVTATKIELFDIYMGVTLNDRIDILDIRTFELVGEHLEQFGTIEAKTYIFKDFDRILYGLIMKKDTQYTFIDLFTNTYYETDQPLLYYNPLLLFKLFKTDNGYMAVLNEQRVEYEGRMDYLFNNGLQTWFLFKAEQKTVVKIEIPNEISKNWSFDGSYISHHIIGSYLIVETADVIVSFNVHLPENYRYILKKDEYKVTSTSHHLLLFEKNGTISIYYPNLNIRQIYELPNIDEIENYTTTSNSLIIIYRNEKKYDLNIYTF